MFILLSFLLYAQIVLFNDESKTARLFVCWFGVSGDFVPHPVLCFFNLPLTQPTLVFTPDAYLSLSQLVSKRILQNPIPLANSHRYRLLQPGQRSRLPRYEIPLFVKVNISALVAFWYGLHI